MAHSRLVGRLSPAPGRLIEVLRPHVWRAPNSLHLRSQFHPLPIQSSHLHTSASESLPRVAQPSLWTSLIPKFLRPSQAPKPATHRRPKSKEWNPATFFIVIFLLIGSQAIRMIALRNEFTTFSRRADARIGLLKEAIERVQMGEDVDVKALLGTGDKAQEKEWEEVMQELAQENALWQENKKLARRQSKDAAANGAGTGDAQIQPTIEEKTPSTNGTPSGFY